jgi:hypothetical protein
MLLQTRARPKPGWRVSSETLFLNCVADDVAVASIRQVCPFGVISI